MSRSMPTACSARSIRALRYLEGVLNIGRAAVASEMVGVSEEVFGRTVTYLKERKQFGKLIGEFQALQHRAAHLYIEIEITRAAVLKALQTLDGDFDNAGAAVAVAKARAGTTATLAVQEGVQMHGGMGMTDQFDIGFFMKRARVCQELFGDSQLPRRPAGADEELLKLRRHSGARRERAHASLSSPANAVIRVRPRPSNDVDVLRVLVRPVLRGDDFEVALAAPSTYRIGGAYWMPPAFQSWLRPRGMSSFDPAPTLRS